MLTLRPEAQEPAARPFSPAAERTLPAAFGANAREAVTVETEAARWAALSCQTGNTSARSGAAQTRRYASVVPDALAARAFEHARNASAFRVHHRSYKLHFLAADAAGSD